MLRMFIYQNSPCLRRKSLFRSNPCSGTLPAYLWIFVHIFDMASSDSIRWHWDGNKNQTPRKAIKCVWLLALLLYGISFNVFLSVIWYSKRPKSSRFISHISLVGCESLMLHNDKITLPMTPMGISIYPVPNRTIPICTHSIHCGR